MIALRESPPVFGRSRHGKEDFRRDHQLVAPAHLAQRAADDLFARAIGIGVRGVEEVYPELESARDERAALLFVQTPGVAATLRHAVGHATEADARDFEAGFSESSVFHAIGPIGPIGPIGRMCAQAKRDARREQP